MNKADRFGWTQEMRDWFSMVWNVGFLQHVRRHGKR